MKNNHGSSSLGAIVAIAIVLFLLYHCNNEINTEPVVGPAEITIQAVNISKEFKDNEVRAINICKGKIIKICGTINNFDTSLIKDDPMVYLKGYDGEYVCLEFTESSGMRVKDYNKGDHFCAECEFSSETLGTVFFKNCR